MKWLLTLAVAGAAWTLAAGNTADSGNLAAALSENDKSVRLGALIQALEVSPHASPELLRCLNEELTVSGCDDAVMKKLLDIWRKRPEDIRSCGIISLWAMKKRVPMETVNELLKASLLHSDLKRMDIAERRIFFSLLKICVLRYQDRYELAEAGDLLDELSSRYPLDPQVAAVAANLYVLACFRDTDTAPGMRNWEDLSSDNVWKIRLKKISRHADDMIIQSGGDAIAFSELALALKNRGLMKKAMKIRRRVPVPDDIPDASVVKYSIQMKMPELLVLVEKDLRVFILASSGDLAGAEKELAELSGDERLRWELYLHGCKNEHQAVREMILNNKVVPNLHVLFFAGCEAALQLQDKALLDKMFAIAGNGGLAPEIANLLAYSCVLLNHRLDDAEKLLLQALKGAPTNSSYLDSYAWLLFRKGNFVQARKFIGEALKNRIPDASVAVIFIHAAEIELAATGDKHAARLYLERAEKTVTSEVTDYNENDVRRLKELLK